jgi:hypothetical protein
VYQKTHKHEDGVLNGGRLCTNQWDARGGAFMQEPMGCSRGVPADMQEHPELWAEITDYWHDWTLFVP